MAVTDMNLLAYANNFCFIDSPLFSVFSLVPITQTAGRVCHLRYTALQITDDTIFCRFTYRKDEMPAVFVDKITGSFMPVTYSLSKEEDEKERMSIDTLKKIVDDDESMLQLYNLYC